MRLYDRLLALSEEAITTLRTIQETQAEGQRNAMASRAANDSIKAYYDSQREAGDELPRLRHDLAKAGSVICGLREQDARIAELLGAEPDDDLVKAVEDLTRAVGDVSRADPRMSGRLVSVMLDECEDLEALEQAQGAHMKSREGLSLATQIAKLTARASRAAALMLREKAETVQPVAWFSAVSTAAVICWCAYLIDTTDEVPLTLQEWLSGRGKS